MMPMKQVPTRFDINIPGALIRMQGANYAVVHTDPVSGVDTRNLYEAKQTTFQIPGGLKVGDQNVGYGTVYVNPSFAHAQQDGSVNVTYRSTDTVRVRRPARGADGTFLRDEEQRPVFETFDIPAIALKEALDKLCVVTLPKAFVRRNIPYTKDGEARTFNSATLADGTTVAGIDCGGAQFSPLIAQRGYRTQEVVVIPLLKDRPVRLTPKTVDAEGNVTHDHANDFEVSALDLKAGVDAQRAAFVAARTATTGQNSPEASLEVGQEPDLDLYDQDVEFGPETPVYARR
jgi:hypothetical protein